MRSVSETPPSLLRGATAKASEPADGMQRRGPPDGQGRRRNNRDRPSCFTLSPTCGAIRYRYCTEYRESLPPPLSKLGSGKV